MGSVWGWGCTGAGMTRDKSKWRWQVKGCNGQRRGTTAALPPPCTCTSSRGPGRATPRPGGTSSQRPLAWHTSATTQNEGSMWHHLAECVVVCCVYAGASARACAALRWVPVRTRESTPPHPLSQHTTTQKPPAASRTQLAHEPRAPSTRARHRVRCFRSAPGREPSTRAPEACGQRGRPGKRGVHAKKRV